MVKIYFKTFGCPTNFSESETMVGILDKYDFEIVDNIEDAFVVILNICTVKGDVGPLGEIKRVSESYPLKKIIVAGCITEDIIPKIKEIVPDASLISTHNIYDIVSVVEETINDNPIDVVAKEEGVGPKSSLPKKRKTKEISIIPICSGCTGKCTYCSVKLVKGELDSYPMQDLVEEAKKSIETGCKEIWITAQDTASYMLDKQEKTALPELIKKIARFPGDFMIRIGMMNIDNLYPVRDEMIEVLNLEKVFKFLHLPAQSGSDKILKAMKRKYTSRDFITTVNYIREKVPKLTISTDIIVGFPGETKEDFMESVKLVDTIQPDIVNASKFRPRPGTKAEEMKDQVSGEDAKDRVKHILSTFEWGSYRKNKTWIGWKGDVIVEEKGKEGTNTYTCRNFSYRPIIVEGNFKLGQKIKVEIKACTVHDLRAVAL